MSVSIASTAYYQEKFLMYQKEMSRKQIEEYNASGKSFEKLKEEIGVDHINWIRPIPITSNDLMLGNDCFGLNRKQYSYTKNTGLDPLENRVSLVPGMEIELHSNAKLIIKDSIVTASFSKGVTEEESEQALEFAYALDRFIKYANDQSGSFGFDTKNRNQVEEVLKVMGLDTSKSVIVNEVEFNTSEHGRLEKSGVVALEFTMLPTHQMIKIFESYGFEFT